MSCLIRYVFGRKIEQQTTRTRNWFLMNPLLRSIPSVSQLLETPEVVELCANYSHEVVVSRLRECLDDLRNTLKTDSSIGKLPSHSDIANSARKSLTQLSRSSLRPVINATGVLLHTGLGRAPMAESAVRRIQEIANGYASVEIDLESGKRSQRVEAVEQKLVELFGGERATVVNNNAGATLLTLAALASGKEVIVSRGELVEIGGSFRMPDVMSASGAIMHEVGTTNKTHLRDYDSAINEDTACLLKVHCSNYRVEGFTKSVPVTELVTLGEQRNLLVVDDIGSGALFDYSSLGITGEPMATESLTAGSDIVLLSGDKLLGGPQCGIIIGTEVSVSKIASHPLMRALRVDKMTLAGLSATLDLYLSGKPEQEVPLLSLLHTPIEVLEHRAEIISKAINESEAEISTSVESDITYLGGGSVPTQEIPTCCVVLESASLTADQLASKLRRSEPAILPRIKSDRVHLDLRTIFAREDNVVIQLVTESHC